MSRISNIGWNFDKKGISLNELHAEFEEIRIKPLMITNLDENHILSIIYHWRNYLKKQRMLVDIPDKRILVIGDIHGDLLQVQKAFHLLDTEEVDILVFDGDIIDRGAEMVECLITIIERQLNYKKNIYYLRGNHELRSINAIYGFRGYCTSLFGSRTYQYFSAAFHELPLAAKVGDWAFITHGGVPSDAIFFHLMRLELKPKEPEFGPYSQLIWNDPDQKLLEFGKSNRGENCYRFGKRAFSRFMEFHALELFVRAHQAFEKGYRWFFNNRLLSIFSSRAGPYSRIDPHFAILDRGEVELIRTDNIKINEI